MGAWLGDRLFFSLAVSGLHSLTLLSVWGLFAWMFHRGVARDRQVVGGKAPDRLLMQRAVREVALGQLGFIPMMYFVVHPLWQMGGGRFGAPAPGGLEVLWQLLVFVLVNDTLFYWSHRALHTRTLYKRVHGRHHRFRHVRGPSAEFAHPIENLANLIAFFAGPCLLGAHFTTLCIWVVIRMAETVEAHSGYAITNSASRHAFHHLYAAKGCYGSFFSPWDRLLGTDRHWQSWRRESA